MKYNDSISSLFVQFRRIVNVSSFQVVTVSKKIYRPPGLVETAQAMSQLHNEKKKQKWIPKIHLSFLYLLFRLILIGGRWVMWDTLISHYHDDSILPDCLPTLLPMFFFWPTTVDRASSLAWLGSTTTNALGCNSSVYLLITSWDI